MAANPCWSIAVFAHNEAQLIRATLENIETAASSHLVEITVLANGCKDATVNIVRDYLISDIPHPRYPELAYKRI